MPVPLNRKPMPVAPEAIEVSGFGHDLQELLNKDFLQNDQVRLSLDSHESEAPCIS